jgi:hypothetical protein
MHLGIFMFATDYAIRIDELARACEDRGFESLFVPGRRTFPSAARRRGPVAGRHPRSTATPTIRSCR